MNVIPKMGILLFFIPLGLFAQERFFDLQIGNKYNILQYRANVREEPTRNSNVIAILSLNDEIEILEKSRIEEQINDVWSFWYKIKYGNIEGYTFGGNIAVRSFITDIDKNGINDYFYFRCSNRNWDNPRVRFFDDIIIYINNQRINTNNFTGRVRLTPGNRDRSSQWFQWCEFERDDEQVIMEVMDWTNDSTNTVYKYKYGINKNGNIEYLETTAWTYYGWDYENDKMDAVLHAIYDEIGGDSYYEDYWWYTLEFYEKHIVYEMSESITDDNGQIWVKVPYGGK